MSVELMSKVWKTDLSITRKMVMLALADHANDDGLCYPSVSKLSRKCSLDERTIFRAILELEEIGYLMREKRSGRSTIYHIKIPENLISNQSQNIAQKHPSHRATPRTERPLTQCHPCHSVTPPLTQCHPTPDTVSPITIIEPSIETKEKDINIPKEKTKKIELPTWLDPNLWDSFVKHRKAIKSPMSDQAKKLNLADLKKLYEQGQSPEQVINQSIKNGWKGLFAIKQDFQSRPQRKSNLGSVTKPEGFDWGVNDDGSF